jgi:hypothetical protein
MPTLGGIALNGWGLIPGFPGTKAVIARRHRSPLLLLQVRPFLVGVQLRHVAASTAGAVTVGSSGGSWPRIGCMANQLAVASSMDA